MRIENLSAPPGRWSGLASLAVLLLAIGVGTAAAQEGSIEVYGALVPMVERIETSGATQGGKPAGSADQVPASAFSGQTGSVLRLVANTTHWGIRGAEPLGAGYRVLFQLESGFQIDTGQTTGPALFGRNTALALEGPLGRVLMGNWDTPYKAPTIPYGPVRAGISLDFPNLLGNPGFGVPPLTIQSGRVGNPADAAFDRRQGNSVQYWSPQNLPVRARLLLGLGEAKGAIAPGGPAIDPTIFGANLEFGSRELSGGVAVEQHDDYFGLSYLGGSTPGTPANGSARDRAVKLFAQGSWPVSWGSVRIAAVLERIEYRNRDSQAGAIDRYERDAAYLLIQPRFGAHNVWLTLLAADGGSCARVGGAECSTAGLGAQQFTAGYGYALSRRTDLYAMVQTLRNRAASTYSVAPPVPTAAGADLRGVGMGLIHYF